MLILSASLVFSMLASSMTYAEENEILMEESMEAYNDDGEVTQSELPEDNTSISIESIQPVELNASDTMEEQAAVQEMADTEESQWTDLVDYNLRYQYKDNVLYVELIDETQPQKPTKFGSFGKWATSEESNTITKIVIGDRIETIEKNWFRCPNGMSYYKNVKEVVLPSTVKKIGSSAFDGDSALQAVILKNGDNALQAIEEIASGAFQHTALTQLPLKSVKKIGSAAFNGCSSLKSLRLGQKNVQVGDGAFGE